MSQLHYDNQCENCGHCFNDRDAKCEDWRIPEKSFICPKCNSYLSKMSPFEEWKESTGMSSKNSIMLFALCCLVIAAIWVATYCLVKYTNVAGEVGMAIKIIVATVLLYDFVRGAKNLKNTGIKKYAKKTRVIK